MASFDFIEASSKGYKFFWDERQIIARLAAVPILIKFMSFGVIIFFELSKNFLRQGLVLLPSYFAEGWLIMQLIRLAFFNERGQAQLTGSSDKDRKANEARARAISAGTIIYVLIKLLLSGFTGAMMMDESFQQEHLSGAGVSASSTEALIGAIILLIIMIWGFRFVWLYVPIVMGYGLRDFLDKIKGYSSSFYLIGTWLLCFVPMILVLMLCLEMAVTMFPPAGEEPATAYTYSVAVIQSVLEVAIAIISSISVGYGIQSIYEDKKHERLF